MLKNETEKMVITYTKDPIPTPTKQTGTISCSLYSTLFYYKIDQNSKQKNIKEIIS